MTETTISIMGVDIGQKRDPTAICVAQLESRQGSRMPEWHYLVRYLKRLPLRTPYPEVVLRVEKAARRVREMTDVSPELYVDATGVGTPIVDLLREGTSAVRSVVPVYFTRGDRRTEDEADGNRQVKLGKAWMVSRLQALLQTNRIHFSKTPEAPVLKQELLDFEIRVDEDANERYGAFRVGTHDDLVTALGLVVQIQKVHPSAPLPPIKTSLTSYGKAEERRRRLQSANW